MPDQSFEAGRSLQTSPSRSYALSGAGSVVDVSDADKLGMAGTMIKNNSSSAQTISLKLLNDTVFRSTYLNPGEVFVCRAWQFGSGVDNVIVYAP